MARLYRGVPVLGLVLATLACSRGAKPVPQSESPAMKPASGEEGPGRRVVRTPPEQGPANGVREGLGGMPMGVPCEEHFGSFDQDQNGKLTHDEFEAFPHAEGHQETTFNQRDVDHNGWLTPIEFCAPWQ